MILIYPGLKKKYKRQRISYWENINEKAEKGFLLFHNFEHELFYLGRCQKRGKPKHIMLQLENALVNTRTWGSLRSYLFRVRAKHKQQKRRVRSLPPLFGPPRETAWKLYDRMH